MGEIEVMKMYSAPSRPMVPALPTGLVRRRPRAYSEWKALRKWGQLPDWEVEPSGYLLRVARENAALSQRALAERIGCSQQAIAQAERWQGNPTVEFMRRWAEACGGRLSIALKGPRRKEPIVSSGRPGGRHAG